jgi:hypothetical protein
LTDVTDTTGADDTGLDSDEESPSVEQGRSLVVTLGKPLRAFQLCDENNPVRHQFFDMLKSEFSRLWSKLDKLVATIVQGHIFFGDSEVYNSKSRNDSVAFLFFRDGVREVTFLPVRALHQITRTTDPQKYHIRVSDYLIT